MEKTKKDIGKGRCVNGRKKRTMIDGKKKRSSKEREGYVGDSEWRRRSGEGIY